MHVQAAPLGSDIHPAEIAEIAEPVEPAVSLHKTVVSNPPIPVSLQQQEASAAQVLDKIPCFHHCQVGSALPAQVVTLSSSIEAARLSRLLFRI
jgi:hypothetical protein